MTLHALSPDADFLQSLREFDRDLSLAMKKLGCRHCGGPLDTANYRRKTRGMGDEPELCFGLCCRRDGCRKRSKPRSVRFLGRKVYGAWVVIMAIDHCHDLGLVGQLAELTINRWRSFWRTHLSESGPFVRWARGLLPPGSAITESPSSMFGHFGFPGRESWLSILKFFANVS